MDILGHTRRGRTTDELKSAEFAVITLNGGNFSLAQSFDAAMRQQVRPVYTLGDSSFFWSFGFSEGSANLSRLAGASNFFEAFGAGECGIVHGLNLSANGGKNCQPAAANPPTGLLRFNDGIIETLNLRMQAGQSEITESAGMRFSALTTH